MLRLELKDRNDTVLFADPTNGIQIHKVEDSFRLSVHEKRDAYGIRIAFATCTGCELMTTTTWYDGSESRDAVYDSILAKIDEYLFPVKYCTELEEANNE